MPTYLKNTAKLFFPGQLYIIRIDIHYRNILSTEKNKKKKIQQQEHQNSSSMKIE